MFIGFGLASCTAAWARPGGRENLADFAVLYRAVIVSRSEAGKVN